MNQSETAEKAGHTGEQKMRNLVRNKEKYLTRDESGNNVHLEEQARQLSFQRGQSTEQEGNSNARIQPHQDKARVWDYNEQNKQ